MSISKNFIFGRILDTQTLTLFFSKYLPSAEEESEEEGYEEAFEILAEHLIREVTADELKFLIGRVEESTKVFFSVMRSTEEVETGKKRRLH